MGLVGSPVRPLRSLALAMLVALVGALVAADGWTQGQSAEPKARAAQSTWRQLIQQAERAQLPAKFLQAMDPDFVRLEFEDLRAYAAEYHPEEHLMVLNRSLSFNAAGGTLRPLTKLTHREVGTLYHELFHAYFDYVTAQPERAPADPAARLLRAAEEQVGCRYGHVNITPVVQRKSLIEERYLSERESWEALNETWAVFIGWTIWSWLEEYQGGGVPRGKDDFSRWIKRLSKADRDADLIGYYEPEDPDERAIAQKRFLAPTHRISPQEAALLLETVLELSPDQAKRAASAMSPPTVACQANSG